jgi:ribonuclease P protein component
MCAGESVGMGFGHAWQPEVAARSSSAVVPRDASVSQPDRLVMKRRNRLSRSRDFDAVYRHGHSTATRYLVLYSFPREEGDGEGPRLGLAVSRQLGGAVERNRLKRRLRAAFDELPGEVSADTDYVLIARPGLGEAVEGHGFPWLVERVDEVFRKERS